MDLSFLQETNFNPFRSNRSNRYFFDPTTDFNVTEASINSMLANISISVLSLDIWSGAVDVNNTEYVNVYQFSHPLSFFLPYGLCLGLTLVFVVISLGALEKNGVAATDGGFLQVLMTTTGDTAMTDVAAKGCLGGADNTPKE
jgi:hypothetical protein